jgi:ABC-type transport system substrate-binding protein
MKKVCLSLLSFLIIGSFLLAGCSQGTATPAVTQAPVATAVATQAPVATATAANTATVAPTATASKAGGSLVVRIPADVGNLDTHTDQLQAFRSLIQWEIYEPLVGYDKTGTMQGVLATSWENPQPTVWRFHLRQGVKFQDGSDFKADAVKYSLERVKDPTTGSWLVGSLTDLQTINVVDDFTIDLTLDKPIASFLDKLSVIGIVPVGSGDQLKSHPVGTGPFEFVEYVPNDHLTLKKNPNYWQPGLPYLDTLTFKPITDGSVAINDLQGGTIDVDTTMTPSEADNAKTLTGVSLTIQPATTSLDFFEINRRKAPLNNPKVFAAIADNCLDRQQVGSLVFKGYGTATNVPILPTSPFFDNIPYKYNPTEGASELAALGYKPGDIKLEIISWGGYKNLEDMAVIFKEGLALCGVTATVNVLDVSVMLDRYNKHNYDIATNAYAPPLDPDIYYDIIWGPRLADDYVRPNAQTLIASGVSALTTDLRKPFYDQLQQLEVTDGPDLPVWFEAGIAAQTDKVKDVVIDPVSNYYFDTTYLTK